MESVLPSFLIPIIAFYFGMMAAFALRYFGSYKDRSSAHPGYTCQEMWQLHLQATSPDQRKLRPTFLPKKD